MDKVLGPAYTGDPGVPHVDKDVFSGIFWGAVGYSIYTALDPYQWQHATQINWHDFAYTAENHQFKQAMKKGKPYKSTWNRKSDKIRESYYNTSQDYFQ